MTSRCGIILAGGANTRLYPATLAAPKSLLPVYDKPMIYYPLSALLQAGVSDILIIVAPGHLHAHRRLLGGGEWCGAKFSYLTQKKPRGIADALIIGADFINGRKSVLALADNIHIGKTFPALLQKAAAQKTGATVFAKQVSMKDAKRFGIAGFNSSGKATSLEEKPQHPKSRFAVTGLYFYDKTASDIAAQLTPSARGELEVTDLNREYLTRGTLQVLPMSSDTQWFDTGTPESLHQAATYIRREQSRQNKILCAPEAVALMTKKISKNALIRQVQSLGKTEYAEYLQTLVGGDDLSGIHLKSPIF